MMLLVPRRHAAGILGLELMSIPIYVLAGFDRRRCAARIGMKYFLIARSRGAILLYACAALRRVGQHVVRGIRSAFDPRPLALAGRFRVGVRIQDSSCRSP